MIKECLIILLLLLVLLGVICLLYATGILKRKVVVTIIENLPIGIFKEDKAQVQEETVETSKNDKNPLLECNNENVEIKSHDDSKKEFDSESLESLTENNLQEIKDSCMQNKKIVYWTPHGKSYHKAQDCRTLLRSKVINSGSINESGKLTACHKCN